MTRFGRFVLALFLVLLVTGIGAAQQTVNREIYTSEIREAVSGTGVMLDPSGSNNATNVLAKDGALTATGALTGSSAVIGGGYGSTGATISSAGVGQFNGALTTDGAMTGSSAVIGGGYGSTGATISAAGVGQFNGAITSDGAVTGASLAGATGALSAPKLTAGSGTGVTVNDVGSLRTQVYKVSVDYTQFDSAGVTHDLTIATLPAKSIVHSVIADVTTPFVCASVCTTATLSATLGVSAGGNEFLLSFDIDNAAAAFGDADGEMGAGLSVAGATNGGYVSWAGTAMILRATSGTGNWGDGAGATNLNAGAITFYVLASKLP